MPVLLVSTYDLGRQPTGLASPAASLRQAGVEVDCVDTSRDTLDDDRIASADAVAFYLPMHTATRLSAPLVERVRRVNPRALIVAYGLYAPLNDAWLRARGVAHVVGPEAEDALVALLAGRGAGWPPAEEAPGTGALGGDGRQALPRVTFLPPDRSSLPPLTRYAALQMPDGSRRVVGTVDATRGCKHLCRHCPIVPVYRGAFRVVPLDIVIADIRAQVAAGAEHLTFGDPDFLNGPTHARRLVERVAAEFPGLTYDVTIKIEHLLVHAEMLPLLARTGCLFVTSAVESIDDEVLARLRKGHTRAGFVRAAGLCRDTGVRLVPTFVAFTPWTTLEGYVELLDQIAALDLEEAVAPVQLAIRLLVTSQSALLELTEIRDLVDPYDASLLTWPWRHVDPRVDALQQRVMRLAAAAPRTSRADIFGAIADAAREAAGAAPVGDVSQGTRLVPLAVTVDGRGPRPATLGTTPPYMTEAWYCCAEPGPEQFDIV